MSWIAYLVRCADGSYYPGITTDYHRRLDEHNGKRPGGAKYTRSRRPVVPVFHYVCQTRAEAARREAKWKAMNHEQKKKWDHS